jgi:hypothetical protein
VSLARVGAFLAAAAVVAAAVGLGLRRSPSPSKRVTTPAASQSHVSGTVRDNSGPLAGARVRVQAQPDSTFTDGEGRFTLSPPAREAAPLTVAAWKEGYLIGGGEWRGAPLEILLRPLPEVDNPDYAWVDPTPDPAGIHNCGNCHEEIFREWSSSGHARSATNRRFRNLYDGTDWSGRPGHGWSLLDEHPHGAGVCAACHAPTVEFDHPAADDLRAADGVAAHGVHCDFCHKVRDVDVSHAGLTHGRFAMSLLRPAEGQLFFGPLDDVTRDEDVFSPLQSESRYCAACHEGVVFGVPVYTTYSEWLDSPAAGEGRSCQSCHMTPTGRMTNLAPGAGGVERDPATLASHTFLPGGREAMLRRCLTVDVHGRQEQDSLRLRVTVTADNVGHRVPTGFIDRHLLLVVEPAGGGLQDGPVLPLAAGGEFAGKPGVLFAKLRTDDEGHPVPFWRDGTEPADTRLVPEQPVVAEFGFAAPADVRVRLLYRPFWPQVAREKSWPDATVVVYDEVWTPGDK